MAVKAKFFLYYPRKYWFGWHRVKDEWARDSVGALIAGQNAAESNAQRTGRDLRLYRLEVVTYANNAPRVYHYNGTNWVEGEPIAV